ncbi:MAG TPA: prepilin-type N-terminal cleavage/methylation domain-containing protein [Solirubrobacteraceae bacterium]|jgi:Tfp pilus assembly protein PilW|nr:prepilin-type N-terminal cleavage/methylation domain-containing protein [Solirubrobacteraceae bacterium]
MLVTVRTNCRPASAWGTRARARLRAESGYTLIELLVACVIGVTVLSATFAVLLSSQQVQARDSEWALVLQEDRAGLARMMHDMRQATKVESAEAKTGSFAFSATIGGKSYKVKYECGVSQPGTTYYECQRLAAEEGKALPAAGPAVVTDVVNSSEVFTYSPSAAEAKLVTAKIELPASGTLKQAGSTGLTHKVVLEDGAFMRNLYLEG